MYNNTDERDEKSHRYILHTQSNTRIYNTHSSASSTLKTRRLLPAPKPTRKGTKPESVDIIFISSPSLSLAMLARLHFAATSMMKRSFSTGLALNTIRRQAGAHDGKGRIGGKKIGRGMAGKGKTAGRGSKGQRSRQGATRSGFFEGGQSPFWLRFPKAGKLGVRSSSFSSVYSHSLP